MAGILKNRGEERTGAGEFAFILDKIPASPWPSPLGEKASPQSFKGKAPAFSFWHVSHALRYERVHIRIVFFFMSVSVFQNFCKYTVLIYLYTLHHVKLCTYIYKDFIPVYNVILNTNRNFGHQFSL